MQGTLYNYPRLVILILMLIMAAGAAALQSMPRLEDPHLEGRFATVITRFPGASAERVEALVTEPIEKKLREVAEVNEIASVSRPGISSITIELKDELTDTEPALSLLRDKLGEVTGLPEGAGEPLFDDNRIYAMTAIVGLKWVAGGPVNYAILGRHAEELDTRLRYVNGTDFVDTYGVPAEEIEVIVDDALAASIGLSTGEIAERIFSGDSKNTAGTVSGGSNRYLVEVAGSLDSLARVREIPLGVDDDGAAIRIGDVADVRRVHRDPPDSLALLDGTYGAVVGARMLEDRRIDAWSERVKAVLADFEATLPDGIEAELIFDQNRYTEDRLTGLMTNLIVGAAVVIVVLLITLGWRASFIAGSILPLAALAALAILNFFGWQIQQMIVTGMIVALGIMVDNAIVLTDGIQTRLLAGDRRSQAVAHTVRRLWMPLLGSTITTVIAFMPIILMPGPAGEFVGGISASVIASLIASYVIAFTIISALAGRVLGRGKAARAAGGGRVWWREGLEGRQIAVLFRRSLEWSIRRPRLSIAAASVLPLMGFVLAGTLTEQFFPPADRDQFHIQVQLPHEASIEDTRQLVERAQAIVAAEPGVVSAHWYIGDSAAKFYYNLLNNRDGVASFAEGMITATSVDDADRLIVTFQDVFDRAFPHAQTLVRSLEQGPPFNAPIEVRVVGPDLEVLRELGDQVRREMTKIGTVTHARSTLEVGRPEIVVRADEDNTALVGLRLRDVADQLRTAIDGSIGGSILEETEEVSVRVRSNSAERSSLSGLRGLELRPGNAVRAVDESFEGVPLTALAEVGVEASVGAIPRRNGERINTIQGFLELNVLPQSALNQLQALFVADGITVPPGYRLEFGGESEERNEAVADLMSQLGVLGILMIIAIVLTFNSFRLAGITFAAAFQAAGLGLLSLWASQYPLGFVVIVGVMGLVGLAINAAIVILSELRGRAAAQAGDAHEIVRGVMATGRHIVSTTLTTVGGFMPLILASGDFWPPFAISIAGGAFLSMIVSFYFAPAAFKLFVAGHQASAPAHEAGPSAPVTA